MRTTATQLCLATWLLAVAACNNPAPSAYETELAQVRQEIAALKGGSGDSVLARAKWLYHQATLTGRIEDAQMADTAISDAMRLAGPAPELALQRARLDFAYHRLPNVRQTLQPAAGSDPRITALLADLAFQEGRLQEAQQLYVALLREFSTLD